MTPYDEMQSADGKNRPHYRRYSDWLLSQPEDRLARKRAEADSLFHRVGITFAVYGEREGAERLIPFDIIPRVITRPEWTLLERGLKQRVTALNMFLKDVWPGAKMLMFLEFFYRADGFDHGFDPEFAARDASSPWRLRSKNANLLTGFDIMDWGLSPTEWQKSSLPAQVRDRVSVIFDGIDTGFMSPDPAATFTLPGGGVLKAGDEILTFVNRNLEPYRGVHIFMRALPAIQKARPQALTLIVGGPEVSYGARPPGGGSWKDVLLRELGLYAGPSEGPEAQAFHAGEVAACFAAVATA